MKGDGNGNQYNNININGWIIGTHNLNGDGLQKNKLMSGRIHEQIRKEQKRIRKLSNNSEQSYPDDEVDEIVQDRKKEKRKTSESDTSTLEDYFKQAIRDAQRTSKRMSL